MSEQPAGRDRGLDVARRGSRRDPAHEEFNGTCAPTAWLSAPSPNSAHSGRQRPSWNCLAFGHFRQEDAPEALVALIQQFLQSTADAPP